MFSFTLAGKKYSVKRTLQRLDQDILDREMKKLYNNNIRALGNQFKISMLQLLSLSRSQITGRSLQRATGPLDYSLSPSPPCILTMSPRELVDHIYSGPAELVLDKPLRFRRRTRSNPCDFNEFLQALQSSETIRNFSCFSQLALGIIEDEWVLLVKALG
jgi:hypothetical protein